MIIIGSPRSGARDLARYLGNTDTNSVARVMHSKGTVDQDLKGALIEMEAFAEGTTVKLPLYHASISPDKTHPFSDLEREEAIQALEDKLGLHDHARLVILHEKKGREHFHVVWGRVDLETRHVPDHGLYRIKQVEVARDLEERFGHARVLLPHQRNDDTLTTYQPSRAEIWQQETTGILIHDVRREVSNIFRACDGPEAFQNSLKEQGYELARGDRARFVILDKAGGVHSLKNRIEGMTRKALDQFMDPLDYETLPIVKEARTKVNLYSFYDDHGISKSVATFLENAYGHGEDYVHQTKAALLDHNLRQHSLQETLLAYDSKEGDDKERRQKNDDEESCKRRKDEDNALDKQGSYSYQRDAVSYGSDVLSDELQTKIDQLLGDTLKGSTQEHGPEHAPSQGRGGRKTNE